LVVPVATAVALYFVSPFVIRAVGSRFTAAIGVGALVVGVALMDVAQVWSKRSLAKQGAVTPSAP